MVYEPRVAWREWRRSEDTGGHWSSVRKANGSVSLVLVRVVAVKIKQLSRTTHKTTVLVC